MLGYQQGKPSEGFMSKTVGLCYIPRSRSTTFSETAEECDDRKYILLRN